MVTLERKLANVMGGKNARACDNCIRKRARWYCPADDAFLCQICDGSVHSANPLARRHERVRLKTSSLRPSDSKQLSLEIPAPPSWHHGFTKKARTPRAGGKSAKLSKFAHPGRNPLHHLVPEICCDEMETSHEESEEQLLYRVPIFDPFVAELCSSSTPNEANESKMAMNNYDCGNDLDFNLNHHHQLHGSLPSEMELAEFAADVESLLGKGLDDESFDIEGLGFSDCKEVKVEDEAGERENVDHDHGDGEIDEMMMMSSREPFELSFDYDDCPVACEEEEDCKGDAVERAAAATTVTVKEDDRSGGDDCNVGTMIGTGKLLLSLDYDGVISAWNDQRSPWTAGERPELDSIDCWPDCMGGCGTVHYPYGEVGMFGQPAMLDGGREARVSRYREKRRTRLFSKKIRYEVRKLNAEKRPRMKGRFVKRANLSAGSAFPVQAK